MKNFLFAEMIFNEEEKPGQLRFKCKAPNCNSKYFTKIRDVNYKNKHFFKFPADTALRKKWFDAINENWQDKLIDTKCTQIFLCEDHFDEKLFNSTLKSKFILRSQATPTIFNKKSESPNTLETFACFSPIGTTETENNNFTISSPVFSFQTNREEQETKIASSFKRNVPNSFEFPKNKRAKRLNLSRSQKNEILYKTITKQRVKISKLRKKVKVIRNKQKFLKKNNETKYLNSIQSNFPETGARFIQSLIENSSKKRPTWTTQDKAFALTLYRRGPKSYKFLRHSLKLPSPSTLKKSLNHIKFDTGLNEHLLKKLSVQVSRMEDRDRCCSLMFDEMAISPGLFYRKDLDKFVGYVDLGNILGRSLEIADHTLVFMIQGLYKKWKQPVAFFFTKHSVKTWDLKKILTEIITSLQSIGLKIFCTICDQGSTNVACMKLLVSRENEQYNDYIYTINNQKIIHLFDVPHLLKNTRNCLYSNDIIFEQGKVAKIEYMYNCFQIDKNSRFSMLFKLKDNYFEQKGPHKMKVSIAAKMLSNRMACAIQSMCAYSNLLPAEAIHTSEFINDIDQLFDSCNGRTIHPESDKFFRCNISHTSPHISFWQKMLPKIESWKFKAKSFPHCEKSSIPFKKGWLISIKGFLRLWKLCKESGFQHLALRYVNQDCLENLFCTLRQHGRGNRYPLADQFISSLKTALLNNLIKSVSRNSNCETDDVDILENLRDYLENPLPNPFVPFNMPEVNFRLTKKIEKLENTELTAVSYVCGYIYRKFKSFNVHCEQCKKNLLTPDELLYSSQHFYTMFREHDEHRRLFYVSEDFAICVANIYDNTIHFFEKFGYINNVVRTLVNILIEKINFDWLTCVDHKNNLKKILTEETIFLVIKKYSKQKYQNKKLLKK